MLALPNLDACLPLPCVFADMELVLAAGLISYGVAHYEPPAKKGPITAPVRPSVLFHGAEGETIDLDEENDALLQEDLS